jgi:arylsulfatase A-like enzyme
MRWLVVLALLGGASAEQDRGKPNILWICADDHAAYVIGAYGNKKVRTPNLDRLAAQGMRFDRAYCNVPLCAPSRQSFITGRYPRSLGVTLLETPFPGREATVAHLLSAAGYDTAAIGKMHFNTEQTHGFNRIVYSREYQEFNRGRARKPLPKDVDLLPPWKPFEDPKVWLNSDYRPFGAADSDMIGTFFAEEAARALAARADSAPRPFFLMVSFNEPHSPYRFPVEYRGRHSPDSFDVPKVSAADEPRIPSAMRGLTDRDKRNIQAAYYTSVEFMDKNVGLVLDALERSGLSRNTLVVFTSDHGVLLGQHGWFEKHALYEPSVRAPLIARFPGRIREGQSTPALVEFIDIVPTLLDYAGVAVPDTVQGRSLVGLLEGRTREHRDRVFVEYAPNEEAMVRTGRWKLIYSLGRRERTDGFKTGLPLRGREVRLYDLEADPDETSDLAGRPEFAGTVSELTESLAGHLKKTARQPERLPRDGDVHQLMEHALPPAENR